MNDLDRKLFACHEAGPYSEAEWQGILNHVIRKLELFLDQPVVTSDMQIDGNGFAGDIGSATPFGGVLQFSWFGRIGATMLGANETTDLSAWVFFRGYGKRLVAIDDNAFLSLRYREIEPGRYGWTAEWSTDEHREFEHWEF